MKLSTYWGSDVEATLLNIAFYVSTVYSITNRQYSDQVILANIIIERGVVKITLCESKTDRRWASSQTIRLKH